MEHSSALFGGAADKYLPMPASYGLRIVLSCESQTGSFVVNGLQHKITGTGKYADNAIENFQKVNPPFYMNMVEPTIDEQLLASS